MYSLCLYAVTLLLAIVPRFCDGTRVQTVTALLDSTAELNCRFEDDSFYGFVIIVWSYKDKVLAAGEEVLSNKTDINGFKKYEATYSEPTTWRLKIHHVQQSDSGDYECIWLKSTSDRPVLARTTLRLPGLNLRITDSEGEAISRQIVQLGTNVNLKCRIEGMHMNPARLQWMRGETVINNTMDARIKTIYHDYDTTSELRITAMNRDIAGEYICAVLNPGGPTLPSTHVTFEIEEMSLHVMDLDKREVSVVTVELGTNVTLNCEAQGLNMSNAYLQWTHEGRTVSSTLKQIITSNIEDFSAKSELKIYYANRDVAGEYTCAVINAAGPTPPPAHVTLVNEDILSVRITDYIGRKVARKTVEVGDNVTLYCEVYGVNMSSVYVEWKREDIPIVDAAKTTYDDFGATSELRIAYMNKTVAGDYSCGVYNTGLPETPTTRVVLAIKEHFVDTASAVKWTSNIFITILLLRFSL